MAISYNDSHKYLVGKPADTRYLNSNNKPYSNVGEVNSTIPTSYRFTGLTVNVGGREFWYASGLTNSHLILKTFSGSTGGGTITGATNGLTRKGKNIALGGPLTGDTTITGEYSLSLGSEEQPIGYLVTHARDGFLFSGGTTSGAFDAYIGSLGMRVYAENGVADSDGQLKYTTKKRTTNTVAPLATFYRTSTGTTTAGVGGSWNIEVQNAGGITRAMSFQHRLDDVTNGAEDSTLLIRGMVNGTTSDLFKLEGGQNIASTFYGPARYNSDFSALYNPRTLVDRGYLTGLTTSLSGTTNNKFLTKSSFSVFSGNTLPNTYLKYTGNLVNSVFLYPATEGGKNVAWGGSSPNRIGLFSVSAQDIQLSYESNNSISVQGNGILLNVSGQTAGGMYYASSPALKLRSIPIGSQGNILTVGPGNIPVWTGSTNLFSSALQRQKTISTNTYSLKTYDSGYLIYFTNTGTTTVTLSNLPSGTTIGLVRMAGLVTLTTTGSTTYDGVSSSIQVIKGSATVIKKSTTLWMGFGALSGGTGSGGSSSSGVTSIATVGNSPNSAGGSISGSVLTLQPASLTFPGVVTTTASGQTFGGRKIFTPTTTYSGLNVGFITQQPSGTTGGDVWFYHDSNTNVYDDVTHQGNLYFKRNADTPKKVATLNTLQQEMVGELSIYNSGTTRAALTLTKAIATPTTTVPIGLRLAVRDKSATTTMVAGAGVAMEFASMLGNTGYNAPDKGRIFGRIVGLQVGTTIQSHGALEFQTFQSSAATTVVNISHTKNVGIGLGARVSGTARLHITGGTTAAGTAPIKIGPGTAMTTPENGALEYHGSHLYFTIGSTRYQLDQQSITGGSGGVSESKFNGFTATTIGNKDIWIGAGAMTPRIVSGCTFLNKQSHTTSLNTSSFLEFDTTAKQYATFSYVMPRSWNRGSIIIEPYWTATGSTGGVVWKASAGSYGNDDSLQTANGTEASTVDTFIMAHDVHTASGMTVTVANTPADKDFLVFNIARDPISASDNLAARARLLGCLITIQTDSIVDS